MRILKIKNAKQHAVRIVRDEKGGTAIEYALIASMIVIAIFVALQNVATKTNDMWNHVSNEVTNS